MDKKRVVQRYFEGHESLVDVLAVSDVDGIIAVGCGHQVTVIWVDGSDHEIRRECYYSYAVDTSFRISAVQVILGGHHIAIADNRGKTVFLDLDVRVFRDALPERVFVLTQPTREMVEPAVAATALN